MLVGREDEVRAVDALLAGQTHGQPAGQPDGQPDGQPVRALLLAGDPGVGKTSVWEEGLVRARDRGRRVLVVRASEAETALPFSGLIDLLDDVTSEELGAVPPPQLHALEVALYRAEPDARPPQEAVIALALLSALRALADAQPLLVAVDDVQWLDRSSEEALAYAARRLPPLPVAFLLARRPGRRSTLERAFADDLLRLPVEPLDPRALRQVLATRLGLRLPQHLLTRVHEVTLGNPLFAVELGRTLVGRDLASVGDDLPVPEDLEELLGHRVADLPRPVRRVLLALALDADVRVPQEVTGAEAVASAAAAGIVVVEGDRVRAAHPLLAAAARRAASEGERRELHRRLADFVADEPRRALHLALAATEPDEPLAARLSVAAASASARGATRLAVELADHALRLTPTDVADVDRLLALGDYLQNAGEKRRITELLRDRVASLPRPQHRVAARLLLVDGEIHSNEDIVGLLEQALVEAGDDLAVRAQVLCHLAENDAVIAVRRLPEADARAEEAVASSRHGEPEGQRLALYTHAWTQALRGRSVAPLLARHDALAEDGTYLGRNPHRVAGQRLVWRGEIAAARSVIETYRARVEERAEPRPAALARLHLCELELRAGRWAAAQLLLDEWAASTDSEMLHWPMYERCRALAAAGRGDVGDALEWGRRARGLAETSGVRWDWLEASRALGLAALLAKEPDEAVRHLGAVWEHTLREGVRDPGAFPAGPDLVDALVQTEAYDAARAVVAVLTERGAAQDHPWARLGGERGAAVVALHAGAWSDEAGTALEAAAAAYAERGLLFDEARTLVALGRAQRRHRKWGAARDVLGRAVACLEAMGASGWVEDARAELARVGARRPAAEGGLTLTERRVADLAVEGLSNKQIARTLVVTVNTVEFHLRNTYAKLGIRSRVQLAAGLRELDEPTT